MADDISPTGRFGTRKLYMRKATADAVVIGVGGPSRVKPEDNLVLRQLQSLRAENKVILERHVRDRELTIRLAERMEAGFDNVRSDIKELRAEVKEMRSELLSLENKLLTNQNEILAIVSRLDEAESAAFEFVEVEDEDGVEAELARPE